MIDDLKALVSATDSQTVPRRPPKKVDFLILDTVFPHPLSPFRLQEFCSYLEYFRNAIDLEEKTGRYAAHAPALRERYHNSSIVNLQSSIPSCPSWGFKIGFYPCLNSSIPESLNP